MDKNRASLLIPILTTFMLLSNVIFFQDVGLLGRVLAIHHQSCTFWEYGNREEVDESFGRNET